MMKLGSLLAGIGGFDLGWERGGGAVAWQVEKDPYRRDVLARRWPGARRHGDLLEWVRTLVPPDDAGRVEFPFAAEGVDLVAVDCPTHRFRDASHVLWDAARRVLAAVRPRFALVQTVVVARWRDGGVDWTPLVYGLEGLDYRTVAVQMSYAAPGRRMYWERQFLLGHRGVCPPAVAAARGCRLHRGEPWEAENLDYGAARAGTDPAAAEAQWGFPAGWTDAPGAMPATRCAAVMDATPPDVGRWWAEALAERGSECTRGARCQIILGRWRGSPARPPRRRSLPRPGARRRGPPGR
jgi:site-specific DNA-cytosine methylase